MIRTSPSLGAASKWHDVGDVSAKKKTSKRLGKPSANLGLPPGKRIRAEQISSDLDNLNEIENATQYGGYKDSSLSDSGAITSSIYSKATLLEQLRTDKSESVAQISNRTHSLDPSASFTGAIFEKDDAVAIAQDENYSSNKEGSFNDCGVITSLIDSKSTMLEPFHMNKIGSVAQILNRTYSSDSSASLVSVIFEKDDTLDIGEDENDQAKQGKEMFNNVCTC